LCSYAGLAPSTHSSGDRTRYGPITKEGSPWLRTVMVEAAQVAVRLSPTLERYRNRIAAKHGRNAAKVAVARKLLQLGEKTLSVKPEVDDRYRST
jgi:transposase